MFKITNKSTTELGIVLNAFKVNNEETSRTPLHATPQPAFTCSKSTIETPKNCMKSVQIQQYGHQNDVTDASLLLT